MEMSGLIDMLIGLVVAGGSWWLNRMANEQKRLEILLNRTREDYATKVELRDDMRDVMDALNRLDAKLDKLFIDTYHTFKQKMGYSQLEISQKRSALENVLIPETIAAHKERARAAGFDTIDVWFQCFNFASLVAFK